MPLLTVQGHSWKMMLAVAYPGRIEMLGGLPLGNMTTVTGIYQVLAGLRRLARWVDEIYRPWFERNILGDHDV